MHLSGIVEDYMAESKTKAVPRILIVDDVEANRFVLRDIISDMGYQPVLTENGAQALRMICSHPQVLFFCLISLLKDACERLDHRIEERLICPSLLTPMRPTVMKVIPRPLSPAGTCE